MVKCFVCKKKFKEKEVSKIEGTKKYVCPDCLEGLLIGEIKLK